MTEFAKEGSCGRICPARQLNAEGLLLADEVAGTIVEETDRLLKKKPKDAVRGYDRGKL